MAGALILPPSWPRSGRGSAWYQLSGGFESFYRIPASGLINTMPQLTWMVLYRAAVTNQGRPLIGKFNAISTGWYCRQGGSSGTDDYTVLGSRTGTDLSFVSNGNAVRVDEWDCLFGTLDHTSQTAALYSGGPGRPVAALAGTMNGGTGTQDSDAALDLAICGRVATTGNNGGGRGGFGMLGLWSGILTLAEMEVLKELAFAGPWAMLGSARPQSWNQVGLWFPGMDGGFVARDYSGAGSHGFLFGSTSYERFIGPPVPGWRARPAAPGAYWTSTGYTQGVAGALAPAGVLVRRTNAVRAGALTPTGTLTRAMARVVAGAITGSGALARSTARLFAGALTPSGTLSAVRTFLRTLVGAITPTGALVKSTARTLAGALTGTGTLAKVTTRALAGALTPTGALAAVKTFLRTVTGAITPSGTLVRDVRKALAGVLTPTGALTRAISRTLTGALTPAGALAAARLAFLTLTGALTPSGALGRRTATTRTGSLTPTGTVSRVISRTLAGVLGLAGVVSSILSAVGAYAVRLFNRSGQRYRLTNYSGPRYAITNRSGPRYTLTNRSAHG